MADGSCQLCDPFTVVDEDGTGCVMPDCMFNEAVNMDGTCKACDPYKKVSEDRLQCLVPECGRREIITFVGGCEECQPHTLPNVGQDFTIPEGFKDGDLLPARSAAKQLCVTPVCGAREQIKPSG